MSSPQQTSTPYLMGTACAGLFTYGIMTSFLGATLPELSARSSFDLVRAGTLFSFLYLPQVPMVFLAGPLIDRFGKKLVMAAGFLCSALALVGMAYAAGYTALGALLVILGLGSCSAMAAANTLIPDLYPKNPSSALNLGNVFFGVGAVFFPWVVALMARRLGLVATFLAIALLVALVAVVAAAQRFPPASMAEGFDWSLARAMAVNPAVIILGFVLFFYSSLEISTSGWIRTFLEKDLGVASTTSQAVLVTFWITLMLGRLAASQVVKHVRGPRLVLACSVGSLVGLLLMVLAPNLAVATAGVVVCGFCYAPVFPTTAGTASSYFSRIFGTVFGMLMALALFGGAVVPSAVGYVAQHQSVRSGLWILAGIAVLLLITQAIFIKYEKKHLIPTTPSRG